MKRPGQIDDRKKTQIDARYVSLEVNTSEIE
jgi:hypothetical protein